ncbi:MAG: BrxE family protein [Truepera sp.]|jgi:hypothetical protein|nr:BrxE family protein [Truepera sp.]
MNEPHLRRLLQLRLAVSYLGERAQFAWWSTAFFEAASKQFLEPVFPKTAFWAQYHGVVEAGRRVHDERLSVGSFHLFRLPEELEQDLLAELKRVAGSEVASLAPSGKDEALETLRDISGATNGDSSEGPMLVGEMHQLFEPEAITTVARSYLRAFLHGMQVFPYFDGKQ